jgi:hypothetical protein
MTAINTDRSAFETDLSVDRSRRPISLTDIPDVLRGIRAVCDPKLIEPRLKVFSEDAHMRSKE